MSLAKSELDLVAIGRLAFRVFGVAKMPKLTSILSRHHDTDSDADYDNLFGSGLADWNLDGRVVTIAGIRIAGLGGIFRRQVWMPPEAPRFVSESDYLAIAARAITGGVVCRGAIAARSFRRQNRG